MQVGIEECSVVVPTVGRPSLDVLLDALAQAPGPRPAELILVDDRPSGAALRPDRPGLPPVRVVRTGGGGPARARHLGWRTARTEWVALLDDDVVPDADWYERPPPGPPAPPPDFSSPPGRRRGAGRGGVGGPPRAPGDLPSCCPGPPGRRRGPAPGSPPPPRRGARPRGAAPQQRDHRRSRLPP